MHNSKRLQVGECFITKQGRIIHRLENEDGGPFYEVWAGLGKVFGGVPCSESGENHSYLEWGMKNARWYDNDIVTDCDCGNMDANLTIEKFCSSSPFGQLTYREDLN
tara:strand:+ start:96 stop:416 length:321 start_codon:yes stop_codon:yes gene_type:complete